MARGTYKGAAHGGKGRRGAVSVYQPVTYQTSRGPITRLALDKESPQKSPRKKVKFNTDDAGAEGELPPFEPLVQDEPLKLKAGKVGVVKNQSISLLIIQTDPK